MKSVSRVLWRHCAFALFFLFAVVGMSGCDGREAHADVSGLPSAKGVALTGKVQASGEADQRLVVVNWPDYIPPDLLARFEEKTGIKVEYRTIKSNEQLLDGLKKKTIQADIVVPSANFAQALIEEGAAKALDKELLSNMRNLDPRLMARLAVNDAGNQYLVPWAFGFTTIAVDEAKVQELLGMDVAPPPNPWHLVFDPKYASRLAKCGIAFIDSPSEVIPAALRYLGRDPYSTKPQDLGDAVRSLKAIRKFVTLSDNILEPLSKGRYCVAMGWSGDLNMAAREASVQGKALRVYSAEKGGLLFIDTMMIVANSRRAINAHKFINFMLEPEVSASVMTEMLYSTGNVKGIERVSGDIANDPVVFPPGDILSTLLPAPAASLSDRVGRTAAYVDFAYDLMPPGKSQFPDMLPAGAKK